MNQQNNKMFPGIPSPGAAYHLHIGTNVHGNVSRCQSGCDEAIDRILSRFVVQTWGEMFWEDKPSGEIWSKYGPLYVHFNDTCLRKLNQNFTYSMITVVPETLTNLTMEERIHLQGIGITF